MAHVYYGDPNPEFSYRFIETLVQNGVDIIEFGIPFTDPTADGPMFQRACHRALLNGMTPTRAIEGVRQVRELTKQTPIVVTTYYNIILARGLDKFLLDICEAGADALLVPNIPLEESTEIIQASNEYNIITIQMITPRTSDRRLQKIMAHAKGFVYATSVSGVTGIRNRVHDDTISFIQRTTGQFDIPIIVGFGISRPEHVIRIIKAGARGIVTGSALCRIYEQSIETPEITLDKIGAFVRDIKHACRGGEEG